MKRKGLKMNSLVRNNFFPFSRKNKKKQKKKAASSEKEIYQENTKENELRKKPEKLLV